MLSVPLYHYLADALGIHNPSDRQDLYIQQLCSRCKVNAGKL